MRCNGNGIKSVFFSCRRKRAAMSITSVSGKSAESHKRRANLPHRNGFNVKGKDRRTQAKTPEDQITIAAIADDRNDNGVLDFLGQLHGRPHCAAGRNAAKNSFFTSHPAHGVFGLGLADFNNAVYFFVAEKLWQIFIRPFANAGNLCALRRLHADNLHGGIFLFEKL